VETIASEIPARPSESSFADSLKELIVGRIRAASEQAARSTPAPIEASMIGPIADIMMIGGASIIACLLYWMFVDPTASIANVAAMAYALSFVINYPHFASSYQLLYGDYRAQILKKKSFFWAAIIAPVLIIAAIGSGIAMASPAVLSFLIQGMYLSVGWHYVKQIFGVSIVASAVQKRYFGVWERTFILLNLYSVWAMSWVSSNLGIDKLDLDGVTYYTLGLPSWLMTVAYAATAITFLIAAGIMVRKYVITGVRPATSSLVGFAAIYFWYLPTASHPLFFYFIPFFHSLQYLLFVYTLKKNQSSEAASTQTLPSLQRLVQFKKLWGFFAVAAVLGMAAFELVPREMDKALPIGAGLQYAGLWFFCFQPVH